MKDKIKSLLNKLPYIKGLKTQLNKYENLFEEVYVPPGHYYSPINSSEFLRENEHKIWGKKSTLGIKLNDKRQQELLDSIKSFYKDMPFGKGKTQELRYYFDNSMYSYSDGIFLYGIIRHFKPKRIIEIGSGFSSALMLDVNDLFFDKKIKLTFIEPFPDRLNSLLNSDDKIFLHEKNVQDVDPEVFEKLEENDILFVDSTHVSKTGSDVNYILFEILPRLKKGVKVHFHDIFHPFEYPKKWVLDQKRNWNENYILRAFLSYNEKFEIIAFNSYLAESKLDFLENYLPECLLNTGGSIWIEKK